MPKITIPTSKNWIISHKGEFNGNVIRSYNADFGTYPGSIAPATRMYPHTTTDDASTSTMTLPTDFIVSFADNQVKLWSVADKVYKTSSESINMFAADTLVDSPTALVDPDIAILGRIGGSDNLIVTRRTDLSRFNYSVSPTNWKVNWWTDTVVNGGLNQPALSNTDPVILETFGNTLLIGNGLNVHSIILNNDGTFSVAYQRLVFSGPRVINWIKATKSRIYIGLKSRYGDTFASTVVEYDLINEIVREMEIEDGTSIGFVYNDNIHIIDNKGQLREYTGTGFKTYAGFPSVWIDGVTMSLPHRNGIYIFETKIHLSISGSNFQKFYGGVWSYDPEDKRLSHLYSALYSKTLSNSDGATNFISTGAAYVGIVFQFFGLSFYKGAITGNTITGIFASNPLGAGGVSRRYHVITPRILAPEINSFWKNLLVKYTPNLRFIGKQTGGINVKYREAGPSHNIATQLIGTWTTTDTFSTSTAPGSYYIVGDEIFISNGDGSGLSSEILSATNHSGVYTVKLNQAFPGTVSGDFSFFLENWTTIGSTTDNTKQNFLVDIPETEAEWIQFKIEVFGEFVLEELQLGWEPNLIVEQAQPRS